MGLAPFTVEGMVVGREEPAESYRSLSLFSTDLGLLKCRCRLSTSKISPVPDLFYDVEAVLNPMTGGYLHYLGEWRVLRSRSVIGSDYRRLEAAGALARIILRNARWLETFGNAGKVIRQALDALEKGVSPEAVWFKALYLLVHSEGYPVLEDWKSNIPALDRDAVDAVLNHPVESCDSVDQSLANWRQDLERWVVSETEFVL